MKPSPETKCWIFHPSLDGHGVHLQPEMAEVGWIKDGEYVWMFAITVDGWYAHESGEDGLPIWHRFYSPA